MSPLASSIPLIIVLNFSHVPNQTVQRWVVEVQRQVHEDFAPYWHMDANIRYLDTATPLPTGAWQVRISAGKPSMGLGGYHLSVDDHGTPYAEVFEVQGLPTDRTLSHEVLEMLVNPYDDRYVEDYPWMWFLEVADPVEFTSYTRNGVHLSNFVFPGWFDTLTRTTPLDFLGLCDTPGHPDGNGKALRLDERTGRREQVH